MMKRLQNLLLAFLVASALLSVPVYGDEEVEIVDSTAEDDVPTDKTAEPEEAEAEKKKGPEPDDCAIYRCPKDGWEVVPVWPFNITYGGCNALSGLVNVKHAPNDEKNDNIDVCCNRRTACYQTCGMPKQYCDHQFDKCGKTICDTIEDEDDKYECTKTASLHVMLAKMGNCALYHQTQQQQCECTKYTEAPQKRQEFLEKLYQKFKPDSLHKIPSIIKKTGDNSVRFATVVTKLVEKHRMVKRVNEHEDVIETLRREGKSKYEEERRKEWEEKQAQKDKPKPKEKYFLYDEDDEDDEEKKDEL